MFYQYSLFGREIPDNELFGSAFQYSVCWPFGVAGLTQLFAVAVDYYHGFLGGFGDILLFYGGGEKESLIRPTVQNRLAAGKKSDGGMS